MPVIIFYIVLLMTIAVFSIDFVQKREKTLTRR
jgi:hypothetical protein